MLAMLEPGHPAEDAAAYFTDLRIVTAMLCITWPGSRNLAEPAQALISQHAGELSAGTRQVIDRPPRQPLAAAGLLTAAAAVLDDPERQTALARSLRSPGTAGPAERPGPASSTATAAPAHSSSGMPSSPAPAPTGGSAAPTAPRPLPAPAATDPSTSPRSWSSTGMTNISPASATRHP